MKRQPTNRIWNPHHDPVHDFRVIAEFTQRFPHLQFVWFYRNTNIHATNPMLPCDVLHVIRVATDRDGLPSLRIPRNTTPRSYRMSNQIGPPLWSLKYDSRRRLPLVATFWLMDGRTESTHPMGWLEPARIESTPFEGDLDSVVWGDMLEAA